MPLNQGNVISEWDIFSQYLMLNDIKIKSEIKKSSSVYNGLARLNALQQWLIWKYS